MKKIILAAITAVFIDSRQFCIDTKYFGAEKGKTDDRANG